jgi:hypothetical protein
MISLSGALRTAKVDVAYASKLESARIHDTRFTVCPVWTGVDTMGRPACPNSFITKRAGCHSANDRVEIENALRPQYAQYVNLDAEGYTDPQLYGNAFKEDDATRKNNIKSKMNNISPPGFGLVSPAGHTGFTRLTDKGKKGEAIVDMQHQIQTRMMALQRLAGKATVNKRAAGI